MINDRKIARTITLGRGVTDDEINGPGGVSMLLDNCEASSHYFEYINSDVLCKLDSNSEPLDVILKNFPSFSIISRSMSHLR